MKTTIPDPTSVAERLQLCLPRLPLAPCATTPLSELALDSMDTVELLCTVHEEFGVRLTEADFYPAQTIDGLFAAIARQANL